MKYILLFATLLGASAMLPFVNPSDPIAPSRPVAGTEPAPDAVTDAAPATEIATEVLPATEPDRDAAPAPEAIAEAGPAPDVALPELALLPAEDGTTSISAAALSVLPEVAAAEMIPVGRILSFLGRGSDAPDDTPAAPPADPAATDADEDAAPAREILVEVALSPVPRPPQTASTPEPKAPVSAAPGEALLPADTGVGFLTLDSRSARPERVAVAPEGADAPAPEAAAPAPGLPQAGAVMEVTARFLNLRAGPSSDERALRGLPRGTRAEVLDTDDGWARIRVQRSGRTGWVFARYLRPADA